MEDALRANQLALGPASLLISRNSLLSALGRPYHGYHEHIHDKAAALAHGIVQNHPFIDGNKRTALYLLELVLRLSGYKLLVSDREIFETWVVVAAGRFDCDGFAAWLEAHIVPLG